VLTRKRTIRCAIEAVRNVAETLTAADAITAENINVALSNEKRIEPPAVGADMAAAKSLFVSALVDVTFDLRIKGPAAAYSATVLPELDVPLRISGVGVAIDTTPGAEKAAYSPSSVTSTHETATFEVYNDGLLYTLTGCVSSWTSDIANAAQGMVSFTVTGHCTGVVDAAIPVDAPSAIEAPKVLGIGFDVAGYGAVISSLKLEPGLSPVWPDDVNAVDGFGAAVIIDRKFKGSFDPLAVLVAVHGFEANFRAGTEMAITTGLIGSVQYNRYQYTFGRAYYDSIGGGDRDGIAANEIGFGALPVSGDDEWVLEFS
jgi:hypothetical protein